MNFLPKLRRRPSQRLLKEGLETGNGLGHIDSGLHASKRSKHSSRFGPALLLFIKSQRNKNIRRAQRGHFELRRKNTNYPGGAAIQRDRFTENPGVATKAAFPKWIRQKSNARCIREVFILREIAREDRLDAERWKKRLLHSSAIQ